ncbi:MAG: glycosyl hydrolase [archaeon]|nr:glycoside hydrolase family protein [Nanoarchaeota archaeon]
MINVKRISIILIILLLLPLTACTTQEPAQQIPEDRYSMHFGINGGAYPDIHEGEQAVYTVTKELDKLGMIWLRQIGRGSAWYEVQSDKNVWDWSKYDAVIKNNKHPWIMEVYGQTGTVYPFIGEWSREYLESLGGKQEIMNYIKDHSVDLNDAEQNADAELYVKMFVSRYKDKIEYWEIGNEGINSPDRFEIVTNTYIWIKEEFPGAVVVLTGVAGDNNNLFNEGIESMDELLAKGMGNYFDVGNFHYYGKIEEDFEMQLEQRYDDYKAVLDKYGVEKPIWVTETCTSSATNSVLSGPSSEELQAQHVVKRLVIFSAKGAEKVLWHDYRDTHEDNMFYQCNLVDSDTNIPKPAYYTFKLVVEKLGYYETVEKLRGNNIWLYKFVNDDNVVYVAWGSGELLLSDLGLEKAQVTHIIEEEGITEPETEIILTSVITLSESPVFLQ